MNTETPSPRTDAELSKWTDNDSPPNRLNIVNGDFARQLERETIELRSQIEELRKEKAAIQAAIDNEFKHLPRRGDVVEDFRMLIQHHYEIEKQLKETHFLERERNRTANIFMAQVKRLQKEAEELPKLKTEIDTLRSELLASELAKERMRAALVEAHALNINVFSEAEAETLEYYSEYRKVLKLGDKALSQSKPSAMLEEVVEIMKVFTNDKLAVADYSKAIDKATNLLKSIGKL